MRPAYLTPKLMDLARLEIRPLRGENAEEWTLRSLGKKFGVDHSTIAGVLGKRLLVSFE